MLAGELIESLKAEAHTLVESVIEEQARRVWHEFNGSEQKGLLLFLVHVLDRRSAVVRTETS